MIKRLLFVLIIICCTSFLSAQCPHGHSHDNLHDDHGHSHGGEKASFKYSRKANEEIKASDHSHDSHGHSHEPHHHQEKLTAPASGKFFTSDIILI